MVLNKKYWTITFGSLDEVLAAYKSTQRLLLVNALNSLFYAIPCTFRCLEMHSKQRYKICICLFILEEHEVFRNNKGSVIFAITLQEKFTCNCTFYESETFSFSSHNHTLESENFRFPFLRKLAKQVHVGANGVRLPLEE